MPIFIISSNFARPENARYATEPNGERIKSQQSILISLCSYMWYWCFCNLKCPFLLFHPILLVRKTRGTLLSLMVKESSPNNQYSSRYAPICGIGVFATLNAHFYYFIQFCSSGKPAVRY